MADRRKRVARPRLPGKTKGTLGRVKADKAFQARYQELQTLHDISQTLLNSKDLKAVPEAILDKMLPIGPFDLGAILLLEKEDAGGGREILRPVATRGFRNSENTKPRYRNTIDPATGRPQTRVRTVTKKNVRIEENVPACDGLRQLKSEGIQSCVMVPIQAKEEVLGVIHLGSRTPRKFEQAEVHLLEAVGGQMGLAVQKARLFEKISTKSQQLEALSAVTRQVTRLQETDQLLAMILEEAGRLLRAEGVGIRVVEGDELRLLARTDAAKDVMILPSIKVGESLTGRVALENRPIAVYDLSSDSQQIPEHNRPAVTAGFRSFLGVPFRLQDKVMGTLSIFTKEHRHFSQEEIDLVSAFADQAAVAIQNARLFGESNRRREQAEALREISLSLTATHNPQQVLDQVAAEARRLVGALFTFVVVPDNPFYRFVAVAGDDQGYRHVLKLSDDPASPYGQGPLGRAIRSRTLIVCEDVLSDPLFVPWRDIASERGIRSLVAVPLLVQEKPYGAILVYLPVPRAYESETLNLLELLAAQAGAALENARLFEETERRAQEQAALSAIAAATSQSLHIDEMLRIALDKVLEVTGRERGYIRLKDPLTGELKLAAHRGLSEAYAEALLHRRTPGGKSDQVFQSGEPLVINDPEGTLLREETRQEGNSSIAWMPLKAHGKVVGILNVSTARPVPFTSREVDLLGAIGNVIGVAVENGWLYLDSRQQQEIQKLLKELSQDITALGLERLLTNIAEKVREVFRVDIADFRIIEEGAAKFIGRSGKGSEQLITSGTIRGRMKWILEHRTPLMIPDTTTETSIPTGESARRLGIRGYFAVPLFSRSGEVIGVLRALTYQPRELRQEQVDLLQQLANGAAIAIENARLFDETQKRAHEQAVLNAIATAVSQSLDLDELLRISLDKVLEVTGREQGYIRLKDPITGDLTLAAHRGISEQYVETLLHERTPGGKSDQVFKSGEPLVINDTEGSLLKAQTRREGSRSMSWFPLKVRGRAVGIMNVSTTRPVPFQPREVELLKAIGNVIGVALENARLFEDSNRLVDRLKAATQQLDAKNKELNTFVYTVSHDLKAPLVSLQGMADLILQDYGEKLDGDGHHYLERLKFNTQHMERLVLDLLALSRVGREARPLEEISLDEVLDDLMAEHSEKIRNRGIRVTRHPLPILRGIRTQVEQVMANLLGNAVKYLGETSAPTIEIGAREEGEMVECFVKDNGIGIDPAYHEKIFEIFQRLKEVEAEGTGVGLAIVKKIIEGVGGRIRVESAKGQGATFYFTWPKTLNTQKHEEVNP